MFGKSPTGNNAAEIACGLPRSGHFLYRRHFALLAAATALVFLLGRWELFDEPFLPTFAMNGALHACALILALRAPQILVRKLLFIALAAALSILTLYVGMVTLQLFAGLPSTERLCMVLAICAASGAITYGSLVRVFWIPKFSSRFILAICAVCASAALFALVARGYAPFLGGWWIAAVWWFAFSGALWYFDTR